MQFALVFPWARYRIEYVVVILAGTVFSTSRTLLVAHKVPGVVAEMGVESDC